MELNELILKSIGARKIRKIRLNSWFLRLASLFIDYQSEHLPPSSRIVEYSFVMAKLMGMPIGKVLDVGCIAQHNYIAPALSFMGWDTCGIDTREEWQFHHKNFHFMQGDIRTYPFKDEIYDFVLCISTLEHIGLSGYYGNIKHDLDGDLEAMSKMAMIIKHGGHLLLTVPYCRDYSIRPGVRVYDIKRIKQMSPEFDIKDEKIYLQTKKGHWLPADRGIDREGVICLDMVRK